MTDLFNGHLSFLHHAQEIERRLYTWLPQSRFFPAKSRQIDSLDLIDLIELPRDKHLSHAHTDRSHWFLGIVRVVSGDASFTLTVPFSCESGFDDIHPLKQSLPPELGASDTGNAPEFFIRLLHLLNSGESTGFHGRLLGVTLSRDCESFRYTERPSGDRVHSLASDTSNSTVAIDNHSVLKLIRTVHYGIHPEIDIGRFLVEQVPRWEGTPKLRGWIEYRSFLSDNASGVVAVLHDFLPQCASAWDSLALLLDQEIKGDSYALQHAKNLVTAIGHLTASMHEALSSLNSGDEFDSSPWSQSDREKQADESVLQAQNTVRCFSDYLSTTQRTDAWSADQLLLLSERMRMLTLLGSVPTRIRIHGDYHLGQVLAGGERVYVIDFEGEPARRLCERRVPSVAMRDVAGMCRSFDYAIACRNRRYAGSLDSGDWKTTSTISTDWLVQIFLEAYESIAQQHSWWISVPEERKILFDYFLLDKAFYELQYEMNHRPDWIGVPLGALQKMAGVMITP